MSELFNVYSLLWWVLVVGEVVGLLVAVHKDKGGWGLASIGGVLAIMDLMGNLPVFATLWAIKYELLVWAGVYIGMGIVWSFWKWDRFTKWHSRRYKNARAAFLKYHKLPFGPNDPIPENKMSDLWQALKEPGWRQDIFGDLFARNEKPIKFKPRLSQHKDMVTAWWLIWPASMIDTFLANFVLNFTTTVYQWTTGVYHRITERNFREFTNDFGA